MVLIPPPPPKKRDTVASVQVKKDWKQKGFIAQTTPDPTNLTQVVRATLKCNKASHYPYPGKYSNTMLKPFCFFY